MKKLRRAWLKRKRPYPRHDGHLPQAAVDHICEWLMYRSLWHVLKAWIRVGWANARG